MTLWAMDKLIFKWLFVILVFATNSARSERINEIAFTTSIKASCSANKETYQKCFQLNEDGCKKMLTELIPKCSKNKYIFPISQDEALKLSECLNTKFEEKLISNGINLDAPCSK